MRTTWSLPDKGRQMAVELALGSPESEVRLKAARCDAYYDAKHCRWVRQVRKSWSHHWRTERGCAAFRWLGPLRAHRPADCEWPRRRPGSRKGHSWIA
eukprot:6195733-Pleurochrysis_carterae.AAC.1